METDRQAAKNGRHRWLADQRQARCGSPACMSRPTSCCSAAPAGKTATRRASPALSCPSQTPGVKIEEYHVDLQHADRPSTPSSFTNVWVPDGCISRRSPKRGLALAQHFVHENRIRQAASGCWRGAYTASTKALTYAKKRKPFGKPLASNQAIQFPLVEAHTRVRDAPELLIFKTAWEMDQMSKPDVARHLSDKVSMCNYRANRLVCEAADRAMQVHGGDRLFAAQAVRAHLPPPPPLPDHRRLGGNPDAQGRRTFVRVYRCQPSGESGRVDRSCRRSRLASSVRRLRPVSSRSGARLATSSLLWCRCRSCFRGGNCRRASRSMIS